MARPLRKNVFPISCEPQRRQQHLHLMVNLGLEHDQIPRSDDLRTVGSRKLTAPDSTWSASGPAGTHVSWSLRRQVSRDAELSYVMQPRAQAQAALAWRGTR